MKVVIVEDESLAAERLALMLVDYDPSINVISMLDSIKQSVNWFQLNAKPDLVFMDIQLGDGLSFEIFEQVDINCPVIFTTAYDAYAIKAFTVNSMAYLLKPVKKAELSAAIEKYKSSPYFTKKDALPVPMIDYDRLQKFLGIQYKRRFLVKTGLHIKSIATGEILYFYSLEKATYLNTAAGKTHLLDYSLEEVEELIDPGLFFRVNRKYIISVAAIEDVITLSNYRLKLNLRQSSDDDILVSRDKMQEFKLWLDK